MYDVVIVGDGPAGISASLYTVRANLKTMVVGKGDSVLAKADKIENYYGFSQPVGGKFLLDEGIKQARSLGVQIIRDEVVGIEKSDAYEVLTTSNRYTCKAVLIATGQPVKKIRIMGLEDFEGKGVSYCTTCDGFFYNNLKVGVVGFRDFVVHEAVELETYTKDITIYTNGRQLELSPQSEQIIKRFEVNTKELYRIDGGEYLQKVFFKDGTSEDIDGLFMAYESASSIDFARKLGIIVEANSIITDKDQLTNLEGLYAAGDCTGGFKQIATAVGQGALAGRRIIEYIKSL